MKSFKEFLLEEDNIDISGTDNLVDYLNNLNTSKQKAEMIFKFFEPLFAKNNITEASFENALNSFSTISTEDKESSFSFKDLVGISKELKEGKRDYYKGLFDNIEKTASMFYFLIIKDRFNDSKIFASSAKNGLRLSDNLVKTFGSYEYQTEKGKPEFPITLSMLKIKDEENKEKIRAFLNTNKTSLHKKDENEREKLLKDFYKLLDNCGSDKYLQNAKNAIEEWKKNLPAELEKDKSRQEEDKKKLEHDSNKKKEEEAIKKFNSRLPSTEFTFKFSKIFKNERFDSFSEIKKLFNSVKIGTIENEYRSEIQAEDSEEEDEGTTYLTKQRVREINDEVKRKFLNGEYDEDSFWRVKIPNWEDWGDESNPYKETFDKYITSIKTRCSQLNKYMQERNSTVTECLKKFNYIIQESEENNFENELIKIVESYRKKAKELVNKYLSEKDSRNIAQKVLRKQEKHGTGKTAIALRSLFTNLEKELDNKFNEIKNKVGFDSKMQSQRDNIDGNVEEKDWKEGYQIIKNNPVALLFTKNDSKESDTKKILKLVLGNSLKTEVEKRLNLKRSDDDGSNVTFNLLNKKLDLPILDVKLENEKINNINFGLKAVKASTLKKYFTIGKAAELFGISIDSIKEFLKAITKQGQYKSFKQTFDLLAKEHETYNDICEILLKTKESQNYNDGIYKFSKKVSNGYINFNENGLEDIAFRQFFATHFSKEDGWYATDEKDDIIIKKYKNDEVQNAKVAEKLNNVSQQQTQVAGTENGNNEANAELSAVTSDATDGLPIGYSKRKKIKAIKRKLF